MGDYMGRSESAIGAARPHCSVTSLVRTSSMTRPPHPPAPPDTENLRDFPPIASSRRYRNNILPRANPPPPHQRVQIENRSLPPRPSFTTQNQLPQNDDQGPGRNGISH